MLFEHQRKSALFVIIFCTLLCVSNCYAQNTGKSSDVLAEVNGVTITREAYDREIEEFKKVADPAAIDRLLVPDGRNDFLRQLVEVSMFETKAKKEGIDKSPDYQTAFKNETTAVLALHRLKVMFDKITASDEEVKKFYDEHVADFSEPDSYHLFQISVDTKEKAESVVKDINSGKSFVEIAKEISIDETKNSGGDRGFVTENDVAPEIIEALAKLDKDKISEPLSISDDLFVVVKYSEKKTGVVKPLDTVSNQIRREVSMSKQQEAYRAEVEKLKKDMNFSLDSKNAELIRNDNLTDEQKALVLAKFDNKTVTIGDVYKELEQIPTFIRPQILGGEGLNDFLEQHFGRVLSIADAEKNYDKLAKENPKVVEDVARRSLVRALFDSVLSPVKVSDEELKDFYNKNLSSFAVPAQMKAHHILIKEEDDAKSLEKVNALLAEIKKEPSKFEEIAKTSSKCPSGKNGGDLGAFSEGQMVPEFDKACKDAVIGEIVGPVKTQFGYHIIRVDSRSEAGTMKFEEVKDGISSNLLPQKQKEALDKYREALMKELNVKIYQENL